MRRFLLITVVTLAVLIAGTVGMGLYLLNDEEFLKSQLSSNSLKYLGRELTIQGPLSLSLGRETTLQAEDIHFANAAWADQPDMVAIGHLLVTFEVSSLFGGKLTFPAIMLDNCSVSVLRNEAGETNWDILPKTDPAIEPKHVSRARGDLPVWFKYASVNNCQLNITSPAIDVPLDIKVSDLSMQHGDDNRWIGKGSGVVNEEPLSLDGWFAPFSAIIQGGPLEHEIKFRLGDVTLQSSGSVQDASNWSGANLTTHLQGPEISDILNEFKLPLFSEGPFDYTLRLNTEGKITKLELDGDLGTVDIKAEGELDRLIRPSDGNIKFSVDGPNLGALAEVFGIENLVEDAFSHETHAEFEGDRIHFRKSTLTTASDHLEVGGHFHPGPGFPGSELDIHFETTEFGRWHPALGQAQQTVGPLTLDGKLSSDSNSLMTVQAKVVHSQSQLEVQGELGRLPDALAPDLKVSFETPDFGALAAITGFKSLPAGPLTIQGQLGLKDRQLRLGQVNMNLAGNLARLHGLLVLENRYAGSDIIVDLDIRNAAEFGRLFGQDGLPDQPVKLSVDVKPDGAGLAFRVNDGNLGKIQIELDGRIPDLQQPLAADADFDISLPRLSDVSFLFPNMKLPDTPFTARGKVESKNEKVLLEKVIIKLAGDGATLDGYINLADHLAGSRLSFDLDIQNVGELGRQFGKEGLPDQPMRLSIVVNPAGKGLDFRASDGDLRDLDIEIEGHIADLDQPTGVDANFDIKLPGLSIVSFLFPELDLPDAPFTASGRLINEQTKTHLEQVQLELGSIKASIDGDLLPDSRFQLKITAAGPDASVLEDLVGKSLPPKPFSLAGGLNGSPSDFQINGLSVKLGNSQAESDLSIKLGDVDQFKGKINSPYFDISHWYSGASTDAADSEQKPTTKREWMFDDTPVMALTDHRLDIDIDLKINQLDLGNTVINEIALHFVLAEQLMQINQFSFNGERGGGYKGEFSLDGRSGKPGLHLNLNGEGVRLGLAAAPGQDLSTYPPMEVELSLDSAGSSFREIASSLTGKLRAYLGSGQVANAGIDLLFSDFLTRFFNQLNPYAEQNNYTTLDCAVIAAEAESGMFTVFPIIIHTEQLTILSDGAVDLNTEKIDLSFHTKPRTGIGLSAGVLINPLIKLGGRLTSPVIEMDPANTLVSGGLAVATLGVSVLAKSMSDRFLSSQDPCGDARKELEKRDGAKK